MLKRICPKCFTRWYSSCSTDETWICDTCKSDIPKSQETVAENGKRAKLKGENMDFKFNINDYVKVKLTDKGIEILKERHEELNRRVSMLNGKGLKEFKLKVDLEGYYKTQMWSLMEIFGEYMGLGSKCVFETNIICCEGKAIES